MRRKFASIFLFSFLIFSSQAYCQFNKDKESETKLDNRKNIKSDNFKKDKFSNESNRLDSGEDMHFTPPDPGDAPISGGLWILFIGSAIYLTNRIRKEKKN